jgi:hypothetical protein
MAQIMIDRQKFKKSVSTQTGSQIDFTFHLSNYKSVRIYFSKSYKDYVLSLNLGNSKKFIITKYMWTIFKIYYPFIDQVLQNGKK